MTNAKKDRERSNRIREYENGGPMHDEIITYFCTAEQIVEAIKKYKIETDTSIKNYYRILREIYLRDKEKKDE